MMLSATDFRLGDFRLDVPGRRLWQGDRPIELSGRYFDALVLLLREHGQLVSKDRFFEEVWSGVVVSDSALTQCIKEIRRQLGDDAGSPRYVETVPRYGYRFVARVEVPMPAVSEVEPSVAPPPAITGARSERKPMERAFLHGLSGTLGGGLAGLLGGLLYGLIVANASAGNGVGTASTVVVFVGLGLLIGLAAGAGVSFGMAATTLWSRAHGAIVAGAALGGLLVGGVADLLGSDALHLLFGRTLAGITGAWEGLMVGALVAGGAVLGGGLDATDRKRPVIGAALGGAVAGVLIPVLGGQLFASSLNNLVAAFAGSKLNVGALGGLVGDQGLGTAAQVVLGVIELMLFAGCVVGGVVRGRRAGAGR